MFNILSGMQEGSRSVVVVSRSGPAALVAGTVVMSTSSSNTVAAADNGTIGLGRCAEYIFEDLTTQTSGKYTCVYGCFEAETDQYSATPSIGDFLKPGTGGTAGTLITDSAPGALTCAKVIDKYALPINPTMTSPVGGVATTVLRIRVL